MTGEATSQDPTAPGGAARPFVPGAATGITAVCRHELRLLLYSPLSYIFQLGFLTALAAAIFLVADFYATDEASLRLLAVFLPWVALILVPALAMRSWPDSYADRSVELAMTLPVGTAQLVIGKFLAGYLILLITLAFTLPFALTAGYLGDPDPGAMAATYLACALLLALYQALSIFAASLTREPLTAFVVSLAILFLLTLLGWDLFGRFLKDLAPAALIDALALFGPYAWLDRMSQGVIELGGLVLFLGLTIWALWATGRVVEGRRHAGGPARNGMGTATTLAAGLAVAGLAIAAAGQSRLAIDLTEAREFTLHDGSRRVLANLPDGTSVTLYWSAHEASVPASIKAHARRIRAMIENMAAASGGRLTVSVVDPKPDTDEELTALAKGLRRIPMSSGDSFFLGLTAKAGKRAGNIPYLDIRRDRLTEYDIALTLNGLGREHTPRVALLSPLIPSQTALADRNREGMAFIEELKRGFDVGVIPFFKPELPEGLDALLVIDASILRTEMLYAIDQYVMAGGRLIVMIDPQVRANRASNSVNPQPSDEINDLSDLLRRWGLEYQGGQIVGDAGAASVVADADQRSLSYPFWMRLRGDALASGHPATASLNEVFFVESGSFNITRPDRVTPLVMTGDGSGALRRDEFAGAPPREQTAKFKPDGTRRVLAAAVAGPIPSAFTGPLEGASGKHLVQSAPEARVFAIADVDWLFDPFSLQTTQVQGRTIVRPLNDNLALLQNLLEFATGDQALIGIRSRGRVNRPFSRVEQLFRAAQSKFRGDETRLAARIAEGERIIRGLPEAAGVDSIDQLPPQVRDEIRKLEREVLPLKRELRDLRRTIREGVDQLGRRLTLINLAAGPILVLLFWLAVKFWRRRAAS